MRPLTIQSPEPAVGTPIAPVPVLFEGAFLLAAVAVVMVVMLIRGRRLGLERRTIVAASLVTGLVVYAFTTRDEAKEDTAASAAPTKDSPDRSTEQAAATTATAEATASATASATGSATASATASSEVAAASGTTTAPPPTRPTTYQPPPGGPVGYRPEEP